MIASKICLVYLVQIFDNIGHSLKHLKLAFPDNVQDYQSIGTLITEKLVKLEKLELQFELTQIKEFLIEWPHLKSLEIECMDCSINLLLRTLSNNGFIEELTVTDGTFDHADENAPPVFFDKLQSLTCELT